MISFIVSCNLFGNRDHFEYISKKISLGGYFSLWINTIYDMKNSIDVFYFNVYICILVYGPLD